MNSSHHSDSPHMTDQPGPELDRLIAEKVMGWTPYTAKGTYLDANRGIRNTYPGGSNGWSPSEDIAHAWEVVEKMMDITDTRRCKNGIPIYTHFSHRFERANVWAYQAKDAAYKICLAALGALKAVGGEG